MKKAGCISAVSLILLCVFAFSGCGEPEDPGAPPDEVINPDLSYSEVTGSSDEDEAGGDSNYDGEILENAVSIRIGRDSRTEISVNMFNNAAVNTMLGYLSNSALLFPTYSYSDADGFVGQNIRGSYTRNDEVEIADIAAGELYLFSDGQLRLYFKDVPGANITATPAGVLADAGGITETVQNAYESNLGDSWGVDVYFWITKNI